jgi:hypothetical protein
MLVSINALERYLACALLCVTAVAGWYAVGYTVHTVSSIIYQEIEKQLAHGTQRPPN